MARFLLGMPPRHGLCGVFVYLGQYLSNGTKHAGGQVGIFQNRKPAVYIEVTQNGQNCHFVLERHSVDYRPL